MKISDLSVMGSATLSPWPLTLGFNPLGVHLVLGEGRYWSGGNHPFGELHATLCKKPRITTCFSLNKKEVCYSELGRELWVQDPPIEAEYIRYNCFVGYCDNKISIKPKVVPAIPFDQINTFDSKRFLLYANPFNSTCGTDATVRGFSFLHRSPTYSLIYLVVHYRAIFKYIQR